MARVTVEDCLERMSNKFELTTVAAKRARQLARGANAHVAWEDDKPTVMALREIADGYVDISILDEPELPPITSGMETPAPPPEEVEETVEREPEAAARLPAADATGDNEEGRPPEE